MTTKEQETIETLIDLYGLTEVQDYISEVCYLKAEHIRASYGDKLLADRWEKAGQIIPNHLEEGHSYNLPS